VGYELHRDTLRKKEMHGGLKVEGYELRVTQKCTEKKGAAQRI
jgi:hypothetical protein